MIADSPTGLMNESLLSLAELGKGPALLALAEGLQAARTPRSQLLRADASTPLRCRRRQSERGPAGLHPCRGRGCRAATAADWNGA
jgi:hypothetical protein